MRRHLGRLAELTGDVLLILLIGFLVGLIVAGQTGPDCPTEDSCSVDYQDGRWHIEPIVP